MDLHDILTLYTTHPAVRQLRAALRQTEGDIQLTGLTGSAPALALAAADAGVPLLVVADDEEEAGYLYSDLAALMGAERVLAFPSAYRRAVKYGQRDEANEILRTEVMERIAAPPAPQGGAIVTHPAALATLVPRAEAFAEGQLRLQKGQQISIPEVMGRLTELGFRQVDYVYEPGQMAVRGSLVDVFSYARERPVRIDFFGDEVDTLRTFSIEDQLSVDRLTEVALIPSQTTQGAARATVLDLLPRETVVVARSRKYIDESVRRIVAEGFTAQAEAVADDEAPRADEVLVDADAFAEKLKGFRAVASEPLADASLIRFSTTPQPLYHKNFDLVNQSFSDFLARQYHIYIMADSAKQNERLTEILAAGGIASEHVHAVEPTLHAGFTDNSLGLCFFTDHQVFDRFHAYHLKSERARQGKAALTLRELQQFELGDYVVHIDHGIGQFGGLVRIPNGDRWQEVIKIIYRGGDIVFVSIHALHKISKYKGKDGEPPRVNALGGGAWQRLKEKTKAKIKDIARDLILLYSQRRELRGFAFNPDTAMQRELEASFLYEDTPDQLRATVDVKADMERPRPMDRLVCGDVGFGKTEVAIRAAFKAAADSKQVAVLVPTTVLALQHYHTFTERLRDMPVRVDYLSRARTARETRQVLDDLKAGLIDIVIGTHKLIGRGVRFKDLGLLIIDEEQKFGVATKERLRQMRANVDTLTLTATPIPRTLQFSLMGARDLSVIQTPPPNRYPIETVLTTFSADTIAEAINFEMSRGGQVFLINNRIAGLTELAAMVHKYVPDARVAIGHGQMASQDLEDTILGFIRHEADVLISTTIVESGIDIPNVNTIIICGAHHFGLSDLHQMRGRVGRSNKKAFCYLMAPPLAALPQESRRRLQAIEQYSDLGSGIHIAMQDLDIRGAGNMLGAEQSGFIADLGYETYQKILSEAVKELRNDEFHDLYADKMRQGEQVTGDEFVSECQLESDLPMYFPDTYVPGSSERMLLYRELDSLTRDDDVARYRQRLADRFGPIPPEAEELIRVVRLRRLARHYGTARLILKQGRMRLYFPPNAQSPFYQSEAFGQIITYATRHPRRCRLEEKNGNRTMVIDNVGSVEEAVGILDGM